MNAHNLEEIKSLDDEPESPHLWRSLWFTALAIAVMAGFTWPGWSAFAQGPDTSAGSTAELGFTTPNILLLLFLLIGSAFFSASEVAFFAIHQVRLRGMAESKSIFSRLVAQMMEHPNRLLITILIGNMIVNVLISVILPARLEYTLSHSFQLEPAYSYTLTVILSTFILVVFGEITPKVIAVRMNEFFARAAVIPMWAIDRVLYPVRWAALSFTEALFRVTRFNDIKAAPFITDDEFLHVLSESEARGVIEEEEGQMIQGILESSDALLREILVPRPDVVAIDQTATIKDALELIRQHEFSRIPVFETDLDHVKGVLFAKDLLPFVVAGDWEKSIQSICRRPNFVPETMTIRGFVRDSQRKRMHLSVVVDEYGGTAGIVTLEDAMEEIVGDIRDEDEAEPSLYKELGPGTFQVDGGLPLDELSELLGVDIPDEEHETVAGFFIEQTNKIPEIGDTLTHDGMLFVIDSVDGKRAERLTVHLDEETAEETQS
jgi:CBS domain containing-hemolysin-like protein